MSCRTRRATASVALLAHLAALTATGCAPSSSDDPAPRPAASTDATDLTTDAVVDSPLQAYRLTVTELTTIVQARSVLISRCMARLGFEVPVSSYDDLLAENRYGEHQAIGRLYGITDREVAAEHGYGTPPEHPTDQSPHDASPAELLALKGRLPPGSEGGKTLESSEIPEGGCVGQVERQLEGDPDISSFGLGHTLWIDAMTRLQGTEAYRAVIGDWARCLAERGYSVTAPLNDTGDIKRLSSAGSDEGEATPAEIKLALADIDCKVEVDLVDRLDDAGRSIATTLIEEHQLALEEDRERLDRQLGLAQELVEESR